jgi:hypothetical protein
VNQFRQCLLGSRSPRLPTFGSVDAFETYADLLGTVFIHQQRQCVAVTNADHFAFQPVGSHVLLGELGLLFGTRDDGDRLALGLWLDVYESRPVGLATGEHNHCERYGQASVHDVGLLDTERDQPKVL